jgi:hypothetical protein
MVDCLVLGIFGPDRVVHRLSPVCGRVLRSTFGSQIFNVVGTPLMNYQAAGRARSPLRLI